MLGPRLGTLLSTSLALTLMLGEDLAVVEPAFAVCALQAPQGVADQ